MEKKQTAVEWLEDRLDNLLELYASEWDKVSNVINQAKEMEKEQIVNAYRIGKTEVNIPPEKLTTGQHTTAYYNKTYKPESE